MKLDMHTMLVMIAILSFLFSILLVLADMHARGIAGLKHWALASLTLSLGFGIAYGHFSSDSRWAIVIGSGFVILGSGLQWVGIQAFKGQALQWRLLALLVVLAILLNIWLNVIQPNINMRVLLNSAIFCGLNIICAKALFIQIPQPERTAHWLTGASFALLATIHAVRGLSVILFPEMDFGLNKQVPINPLIFFTGAITQLFITFGFILMVNYRLSAELETLASTDPLTGAWNRRSLENEFKRLLARSQRNQETLTIMMLDVDHFKAINDQFGHLVGDEVLRNLIADVKTYIRGDDYLARYGGEEFCLLLPATDEEEAIFLAERLRQFFAQRQFIWQGISVTNTVSIGVASTSKTGLNYNALLEAADKALYQAKQTGRNKVVTYSELDQGICQARQIKTAEIKNFSDSVKKNVPLHH
jgi:diguanylate cyclase (GGDEF)-like protein